MKHKIIMAVVMMITALLLTSCQEEESDAEQTKVEDKPAVSIVIPKRCTTGTLTVYKGGVKELDYSGEIEIVNDGRNGESVEIYIYAEDYTDGEAETVE